MRSQRCAKVRGRRTESLVHIFPALRLFCQKFTLFTNFLRSAYSLPVRHTCTRAVFGLKQLVDWRGQILQEIPGTCITASDVKDYVSISGDHYACLC